MAGSALQQSGAQPQRQPKYVPLFIDRAFTGIVTQRSVLHDPSDIYTARYYGGRPDALWMGLNVELTNRLTLQRRPGMSALSATTYPTPPDRSFSFQLLDGTIQLIVDTGTTGSLAVTSVGAPSAGSAVYTGTFLGAGSNAYAGLYFAITGFTNAANNGTFLCTASTITTLTLSNPNSIAETHSAAAQSSGAVYVDNQNGTKTFLFAKNPAAGQAYFVGVAGVLYIGDGVDTKKYTPGNTNGVIWNWGIVAPANQPNVVIIESGAAAVSWEPNTVWSTMGLLYDTGTNTTQQLHQVLSNTDNTTGETSTELGLSGNGNPAWNNTPGGTTTDGTITWTNRGPIVAWTANTVYNNASVGGTATNPCIIYDPVSQSCYIQANAGGAQGRSGASYPHFTPGTGQATQDGGVKWFYIGTPGIPGTWQPSHLYPAIGTVSDNDAGSSVSEPIGLSGGLPANQTVYWQVSGGGTSGATATAPPWNTNPGQITGNGADGDLNWLCLGSDQWQANHAVAQWTGSGSLFTAIVDTNGNFQVCIQTGVTSGTEPTWATAYGVPTTDGTAIWTCVGTAMTWAANTQWYLPVSGFAPPTSSQPFGGASVIDTNDDVEFVINSGKGGATHPAWAASGQKTTDGAATWYNLEPFTAQSLSWSIGHVYAYSFKARALDDFYSTIDPSTNALPIPPGLSNALPAPTGSETGAISTASPVYTITGGNTGAVNTVSGLGSIDPQVDTIVIWRDADGGGPDQMFELTEIPAPPAIGGVAQPWSFKDYLPDVATNQFPGLNPLIPAPIDESNNPPPSTFLPMVYNFERIWGADGSDVPWSGGPDVITGNPNEAFNPSDELPFLASVTRLVKTTQGIVTFLTDSIEVIAGGPLTSSFFSVTVGPGIGLVSFNALDVFAGELFFFSSDNQFRVMSTSLNISNAGFALGDQFANLPSSGVSDTTWNPANVYVTVHQNGIDNAVFVSDGSTGWYRLNPRQVPGAAQGPEPIWSPFAIITGGAGMVQSVETAPGTKKLLVGGTGANEPILYRNLAIFTDNGTPYDAYFTMGAVTLAQPGQLALLKFLEFDFSGVSYQPTVSYLLNEISGTFTLFVLKPVFDPPSIYGATIIPGSYSPNRYYFSGNASLARARHIQIKVDFGTTSNGDEIYTAAIFGRLVVET